jgi:hypothetical protein
MPTFPTGVVTAGLLCGLANVACANCGGLIDALEKADRTQRFAQHDVIGRDAPMAARPMLARIGAEIFVMGMPSVSTGNPLLTALRAREPQRTAKCDAPVPETVRGVSANRIAFINPLATRTMSRVTVWVSVDTGLPVYHEIPGLRTGGFAWVYGDAVSHPKLSVQTVSVPVERRATLVSRP